MTWYLVLWIGWSCPGGFLSKLWPAAARPLVCKATPEYFRTDSKNRAYTKLLEVFDGEDTVKYIVCEKKRKLKCVKKKVTASLIIELED